MFQKALFGAATSPLRFEHSVSTRRIDPPPLNQMKPKVLFGGTYFHRSSGCDRMKRDLIKCLKFEKTKIDVVDVEKKLVIYTVIGGEILSYYKSFVPTLAVASKGDGGAVVTWSVEYEKLKEDAPGAETIKEFALKLKADGSFERCKARLVTRGFSQQYREDYEEMFSPVAKRTLVLVVIALAACQGWRMWQLDVNNDFLYGEIDKDIFMVQPPGYVSEDHPGHFCKLRKTLYVLKQTSRAWYGKITEYLQFCGYFAFDSNSSLFVKKKGELHVLVLLYVDDMIVTINSKKEVARLRAELAVRFEMKDLRKLHHFLGLEMEWRKSGILVSQRSYAERIVQRFGMREGKSCTTPLDVGLKLRRDEGRVLSDPLVFRALVGSLIYLMITRPDIAYVIGRVNRYMAEPRKPHLLAAKNILKYVKITSDMRLIFGSDTSFNLHDYTDVDYGGD
ncbi:MLP-like protein 423 [Platanthera zijinensis]|uniref:MLP-like protein 423 n=1 Tax=Platanthera zijinensis TaxID=2320716 RepID=A0AAP0BSM4_9ASPA